MAVVRALRVLFVLAMLLSAPGVAGSQEPAEPPVDAGDEIVDLAPVTLDGHELFRVRGIQAYPAKFRAEVISTRILDLARDRSFDPAHIDTTGTGAFIWIGPEGRRIMRIHDVDGEVEGVDRFSVAELYTTKIRESIVAFRAARSHEALIAAAWRAGLATILALLAFFVVRLLYRAVNRWESRASRRVKSVRIGSFEVVGANHIWAVLRAALRIGFAVGGAMLAVTYLQYVLGLFPWTWSAAHQLHGWVLAPIQYFGRGLLAIIPDLIFLVILFFVTRYVLQLIRSFFDSVASGSVALNNFYPEWASPTHDLIRVGVIAFSMVLAYPHIPGASSEAFKGVSIFMGAILSLGSTGVISNIIAGYTMVYRRAFQEGDLIQVGDVIGFVSKIRLQVTHLRTPKNEEVIVPNVKILGSEVINFTTLAAKDGLILHTTVGIGYETPWRQVEAMLLEAASRTPGLLEDPKPFVRKRALGDFAVTYEINAFCSTPNQMILRYNELHANILDVFNEHNVQIMTPAYEGDPEKPKVVPREEWFLPPAQKRGEAKS